MSTTSSNIPRSPNRLPAPRPGIVSGLKKPVEVGSAPSTRSPGPKTPGHPSKSSGHARSPSRLPKSPGARSTASSSGEPAKKGSTTPVSPQPAKKGTGVPTTRPPATPATPSPRPTPETSPKTPNPKIIVTPPSTPEKSSTKRVDAAIHRSALVKALELVPKQSSPYIAAHLGDPCTVKALDHILDCGHKIITTQPESCASNCQISHSTHASPRSLDQGVVCLTCIIAGQQAKHDERVKSFREELEHVAKATKKPDPEQWIEAKIGFMEKAWRDLESEEMVAEAKEGRFAYPVYVDPANEGVMITVVGERLRAKARAQLDAAKAVAEKSATGL